MGRRTLRVGAGFLPILLCEGVHHYSCFMHFVPDGSVVVEARVENHGVRDGLVDLVLVLVLENEGWEPGPDGSAPDMPPPSLVRHHCVCKRYNGVDS